MINIKTKRQIIISVTYGIPEKWDQDPGVGPWGGTLEWDSHICFYNVLNHIIFFIRHQKTSIWIIFFKFENFHLNYI